MNLKPLCLTALLSTGLLIACDQSSTTPSTPAADTHGHSEHDGHDHSNEKTLTEQAGDMASDAKDATVDAANTVKEETKEAVDAAAKQVDAAIDSSKDAAAPAAPANADAPATPAAAASGLSLESLTSGMSLSAEQTEAAFAQVRGLIGAKNFDLAQQWISKLDGVTLPAGYQEKLDSLKSLLDSSKGAGDLLNNAGGMGN